MKTSLSLRVLLLAAALASVPHLGYATVIADQQNPGTDVGNNFATATGGSIGQTFTPATASIQAVSFLLGVSGTSATLKVDLFSGAGFSGTLLASTAAATFTNATAQTVEFDFALPQLLIPNNVYTLRLNQTAGDQAYLPDTADTYARGNVFSSDFGAVPPLDLVFAEGALVPTAPAVPEPSTWAAVALGAGLLVGVTRRRRAV